MGLLLICPECNAKVPIQSQKCPQCGADLSNLPDSRRQYFIGKADEAPVVAQPEPAVPEVMAGPVETPMPEAEPVPMLEEAPAPEAKVEVAAPEVEVAAPVPEPVIEAPVEEKKPEKETKKKKRTSKKKS